VGSSHVTIKAHQRSGAGKCKAAGWEAKDLHFLLRNAKGHMVDDQELPQTRLPLLPWFAATQKRLECAHVLEPARQRSSAIKGAERGMDVILELSWDFASKDGTARIPLSSIVRVRPNSPIAGFVLVVSWRVIRP